MPFGSRRSVNSVSVDISLLFQLVPNRLIEDIQGSRNFNDAASYASTSISWYAHSMKGGVGCLEALSEVDYALDNKSDRIHISH